MVLMEVYFLRFSPVVNPDYFVCLSLSLSLVIQTRGEVVWCAGRLPLIQEPGTYIIVASKAAPGQNIMIMIDS